MFIVQIMTQYHSQTPIMLSRLISLFFKLLYYLLPTLTIRPFNYYACVSLFYYTTT